jgi:hypothetical protein
MSALTLDPATDDARERATSAAPRMRSCAPRRSRGRSTIPSRSRARQSATAGGSSGRAPERTGSSCTCSRRRSNVSGTW